MNLPNRLTVMRMILVPFFVAALLYPFPHHFLAAFVLFAVASYTDHLDGKIARKRNLITNFGKFMDPLADKVMVLSAMVCLVSLDLADVWIVVLMLAREFMVTSIRLVAADRGRVIAANIWGKAKTVSQIIAILAVLLMQYLLELGGMGSFTAVGRKWADHGDDRRHFIGDCRFLHRAVRPCVFAAQLGYFTGRRLKKPLQGTKKVYTV